MLTIRLWQSLNRVLDRDPFYWQMTFQHRKRNAERALARSVRQQKPASPMWRAIRGVWNVARGLLSLYLAFALLFVAVPLIPIAFLTAGTILGLRVAYALSVFVSGLYEKKRVDLLAVSPPGLVGLYWTLARVFYWRLRLLQTYGVIIYGLCIVMGLFILLAWVLSVSNLLFVRGFGDLVAQGFRLNILIIGFIPLAIYVDIQQSILVGVLLGGIVPSFGWDRLSANVLTVSLFLSLQALIYAITLLFISNLQRWMLDSRQIVPLSFILFYLLREAVIRFLWGRWIARFERG